jgi:hypothetical protein
MGKTIIEQIQISLAISGSKIFQPFLPPQPKHKAFPEGVEEQLCVQQDEDKVSTR